MSDDEFYMARALQLAQKAWGKTAPNPMVGAVLVKGGRIIAEGYHHADGLPHAEKDCLSHVNFSAPGATMYVSLEPCSTHGRTGACCEAICSAGISEVVAACEDPNPLHRGRAWPYLASRGVKSRCGVLESQARELNFIFNKNIVSSEALLAIKFAVSKDGKLTRRRGEPTRVSGDSARADTMKWRSLFQSIGVGFGTLLSDNPRLTRRLAGRELSCPLRLIFDASARLADFDDLSAFNVFGDSFKNCTRVVCSGESSEAARRKIESLGAALMHIDAPKDSPAFWNLLKRGLYRERICSVFIEGGAGLFESICRSRAADYVFGYQSGETFGCGLDAFSEKYFDIKLVEEARLGGDTLRRGYPLWIRKQ